MPLLTHFPIISFILNRFSIRNFLMKIIIFMPFIFLASMLYFARLIKSYFEFIWFQNFHTGI